MNNLIRQWLVTVLGYSAQNVIRANQEGPIPTGNFATYQLIAGVTSEHSIRDATADNDDLDIVWYNRGEYTFQVDLYDSDGMSKQHQLSQSGYLLSVRQILQPYHTVLLQSGGIQDLTDLMDTKHKARYQCDYTFRLWNTLTEVDSSVNGGYLIKGKYQPIDETVTIDARP